MNNKIKILVICAVAVFLAVIGVVVGLVISNSVNEQKIETLSFTSANEKMVVGDVSTLNIILGPDDAKDKTLLFSSSDTSIVEIVSTSTSSVDIKAVSEGEATITVVSRKNNKAADTLQISVSDVEIKSMKLVDPDSGEIVRSVFIPVGISQTYEIDVSPANANTTTIGVLAFDNSHLNNASISYENGKRYLTISPKTVGESIVQIAVTLPGESTTIVENLFVKTSGNELQSLYVMFKRIESINESNWINPVASSGNVLLFDNSIRVGVRVFAVYDDGNETGYDVTSNVTASLNGLNNNVSSGYVLSSSAFDGSKLISFTYQNKSIDIQAYYFDDSIGSIAINGWTETENIVAINQVNQPVIYVDGLDADDSQELFIISSFLRKLRVVSSNSSVIEVSNNNSIVGKQIGQAIIHVYFENIYWDSYFRALTSQQHQAYEFDVVIQDFDVSINGVVGAGSYLLSERVCNIDLIVYPIGTMLNGDNLCTIKIGVGDANGYVVTNNRIRITFDDYNNTYSVEISLCGKTKTIEIKTGSPT